MAGLFKVKVLEGACRRFPGFTNTKTYPVLFVADKSDEFLVPNDDGELYWLSIGDVVYQGE